MTIAGSQTIEQRYTCPYCKAAFETVALRKTEGRTYRGYGYHSHVRECPSKCPSCGRKLAGQFRVATINEAVFKQLVDKALGGNNTRPNGVVGSWKLVAQRVGDNTSWAETPRNVTQLKHITESHYAWVRFDMDKKSMVGAGGGTYAVDGDKYIELVQYAFGDVPTQLLGQKQEFTWNVEGDTFQQSGRLSDGVRFEEKYVCAAKS